MTMMAIAGYISGSQTQPVT